MNKQDYNSNFKMKISRSLTDLQNSLDEACRLGLPPHFETTMNNHYDVFNKNYSNKNDISQNLERIIINKERSMQHSHYPPPTNSLFQSQNEERDSNNSVQMANHRERYLNVLRSLADDHRTDKMIRSHSYDVLNQPRPNIIESNNHNDANEDLKVEVRMLRQRLVQMDEEIIRIRSEETTRDHLIDEDLCEELRKKIETYRIREQALLGQLHDAVNTIEEAKYEEMEAMMQAEKSKEDLENMERRFKEYIEEHVKKMGNQSESIERDVQLSINRVMGELEDARMEIREKFGECQSLREQLKNAHLEIERLNMTMKSVHNDRCSVEHSLEASVARAMMQRDETVSQNTRLQGALDKERSERDSERSILQEEINDLRKRLGTAENNEVNATQERVMLMKECDEVKNEFGKMKQSMMTERRREKEDWEKKEREWEGRVRKVTEELNKKQIHFDSVIGDADNMMNTQVAMIERLKSELSSTVKEMERWAENSREEKEELRWRLARSGEEVSENQARVRQLQEVVEDQGRILEAMRGKCKQMEESKDEMNREILTTMTARNGLMRTVELLQAHLTEIRRRVVDCHCGLFDAGEQLINTKILEHPVAIM